MIKGTVNPNQATMMSKHDFIGNFLTQHYTVLVDGKEVDSISAGVWANLEDTMNAAENKLDKKIMAGKRVITRYVDINNNRIKFWTYNTDGWWTL